jgi:hypothetical protein
VVVEASGSSCRDAKVSRAVASSLRTKGHGFGSVQPSLLGDLYFVQFLDAHVRSCCAVDCGNQQSHEAAGVGNYVFHRPSFRAAWQVPLLVGEGCANIQHLSSCQVHSDHALLAHCVS